MPGNGVVFRAARKLAGSATNKAAKVLNSAICSVAAVSFKA